MDVSYTYLDNDELHQIFDYCVSSPSNTNTNVYSVYLCIYDINRNCKVVTYTETGTESETIMPFLKYIVRQTDTHYTFPSFQHACSNDSEDNETIIINSCFLRILDILGLSTSPDPTMNPLDIKTAFKGFVRANETAVFAVFDFAKLMAYFTQIQSHTYSIDITGYKWAIVDELVFEKRVLGVIVDPVISSTFAKYSYLWNIKYRGREIDFPFCLLNVKSSDESYINEPSPLSISDTVFKQKSIVKIGESDDKYKYGSVYGDMHLFSNKPVRETVPHEHMLLQRYAVFTIGAKYIVDDVFNTYMKSKTEQTGQTWNPLPITESLTQTQPSSEEEEDTKDEQEIENMMVSCIYFIEDKLFSAQVPLWGIRQPYRFEMV